MKTTKKKTAKKAPIKKTATKKTVSKKTPTKKAPTKKTATQKSTPTKKKRQAQREGMRAMLMLSETEQSKQSYDSIDRLNAGAIELQHVPIERLHCNPFQPRKTFEQDMIEELADSIREHGFFGHLVVRAQKGKRGQFEIAFGERRMRAAALAGLKELPCEVRRDLDDRAMLELAIVENAQRRDLNPAEEIEAVAELKKMANLSMKELAHKIGKSKTWVVERLNIAKHKDILEAVRNGLPWTTGTELARIERDADRDFLLQLAIAGEITRDDLLDLRAGHKVMRDFQSEHDAEEDTHEEEERSSQRQPRLKTSMRRINKVLTQLGSTPINEKEREVARESLREIIERAHSLLNAWEQEAV